MADNNKENRMSIDDFDFAHEDANDDTSMLVNYLVTRLHQAMGNPALQGEVQQQLHAYGILPPIQQERGPERFQGETSKRGLSTEKGVENPYQERKQLLEGKPSSKKKGQAQPERSPSREREESESSDESMEDVAPRRRRAQRSPTPTKRKRSPHSPHRRESKRDEKNSKKKKERKRSPSSPSSSPSSSSDEGSGYSSQERQRRGHRRSYAAWKRSSKLKKFKEGGKNISFLTYDGTFGATDKVLAFIQQFDAAFGDEGFTESSKLRHVAMHFQKSARQWWASLRANGEAPKTWKTLRTSIMKQFLASDAKDKVLTEWRSLKLSPYESIHKYVDKFWDLHLKATVYKKIDFEEQKQQFCAGLPEDMNDSSTLCLHPKINMDVSMGSAPAPTFTPLSHFILFFEDTKYNEKLDLHTFFIRVPDLDATIALHMDAFAEISTFMEEHIIRYFVSISPHARIWVACNLLHKGDCPFSKQLRRFQEIATDAGHFLDGQVPGVSALKRCKLGVECLSCLATFLFFVSKELDLEELRLPHLQVGSFIKDTKEHEVVPINLAMKGQALWLKYPRGLEEVVEKFIIVAGPNDIKIAPPGVCMIKCTHFVHSTLN
ncbi:hypothetical protein L7F22_033889 [Adiantum nelumboides]|nr:hypothetical protein [Adiantum nelumboides]